MSTLKVIHEGITGPNDIGRAVRDIYQVEFIALDVIDGIKPDGAILIDVDLGSAANVLKLKDWLADRTREAIVYFVIDPSSHHQISQASGLGATAILHRPIDIRVIAARLETDFANLAICPDEFSESAGARAVVEALKELYGAACFDKRVNMEEMFKAGGLVAQEVSKTGIGPWIEMVQRHHSRTYRHSLLVAGISAAFAQHLGFSLADQNWLTTAGLLHDVGKAKIPVALLEKPAALTSDERAAMRCHPELGAEILSASQVDAAIIQVVRSHHEYLDGSGYPQGLRGPQISDHVRMITIADVFAALIEERRYKSAFPPAMAYKALQDMGAKVDVDLVREFRFMSDLDVNA